jgi:hypothetical protein
MVHALAIGAIPFLRQKPHRTPVLVAISGGPRVGGRQGFRRRQPWRRHCMTCVSAG